MSPVTRVKLQKQGSLAPNANRFGINRTMASAQNEDSQPSRLCLLQSHLLCNEYCDAPPSALVPAICMILAHIKGGLKLTTASHRPLVMRDRARTSKTPFSRDALLGVRPKCSQ